MEEEIKMVTTIDGTEHPRENCRYIKGNYYLIGNTNVKDSGQCYLVDGKYCREETNFITYDHGLCKYVRKNESLIYGVIGLEKDMETPIFGYFSKNPVYNVEVILKNHSCRKALHENIFNNSYYKEKIDSGKFWHISKVRALAFNNKRFDLEMKNDLPYNSKDVLKENIKIYDKFNNSNPYKYIKNKSELIKDFTYGLEFETNNGFIPKRICRRLGLIALRDGSVSGLEYVTIPLKGAQGLQTIVDSCKELKKRTSIGSDCSLHLHIGGVPRTIGFITALYKVLIHIEDEFYKLFPLYKRINYGVKRKSYTKPLPVLETLPDMDKIITDSNLVNNFNVLFKYFSMGQNFKGNFSSLDQVASHPSDPNGTSKWYIKSRYHGVNFIPLIFGNKKTIEFRLHTPTYDYNKILNFIFITSALLKFTMKYEKDILADKFPLLQYRLHHIFSKVYDTDFSYKLAEYCNNRSSTIKHQLVNDGNILSNEDDIISYINWDDSKKEEVVKSPYTGLTAQELHDALSGIYPSWQTVNTTQTTPVPEEEVFNSTENTEEDEEDEEVWS